MSGDQFLLDLCFIHDRLELCFAPVASFLKVFSTDWMLRVDSFFFCFDPNAASPLIFMRSWYSAFLKGAFLSFSPRFCWTPFVYEELFYAQRNSLPTQSWTSIDIHPALSGHSHGRSAVVVWFR